MIVDSNKHIENILDYIEIKVESSSFPIVHIEAFNRWRRFYDFL